MLESYEIVYLACVILISVFGELTRVKAMARLAVKTRRNLRIELPAHTILLLGQTIHNTVLRATRTQRQTRME